jgi:hypothetical protein
VDIGREAGVEQRRAGGAGSRRPRRVRSATARTPYSISGRVAHGDKLGATWAFRPPTCRCAAAAARRDFRGARARPRGDAAHRVRERRRAAHGEDRDGKPLLEVFIFDFDARSTAGASPSISCTSCADEARYPTSTR